MNYLFNSASDKDSKSFGVEDPKGFLHQFNLQRNGETNVSINSTYTKYYERSLAEILVETDTLEICVSGKTMQAVWHNR